MFIAHHNDRPILVNRSSLKYAVYLDDDICADYADCTDGPTVIVRVVTGEIIVDLIIYT